MVIGKEMKVDPLVNSEQIFLGGREKVHWERMG